MMMIESTFMDGRPELEASQIITMFPMDECMDCECQKYEDGILNSLLTMLGLNPIPFSEDNVYQTVSDIYTSIMLVVNTWYNNSVTPAAIAADAYMKKVKNGEPSESEKDSE